jgi:hypothetical protein
MGLYDWLRLQAKDKGFGCSEQEMFAFAERFIGCVVRYAKEVCLLAAASYCFMIRRVLGTVLGDRFIENGTPLLIDALLFSPLAMFLVWRILIAYARDARGTRIGVDPVPAQRYPKPHLCLTHVLCAAMGAATLAIVISAQYVNATVSAVSEANIVFLAMAIESTLIAIGLLTLSVTVFSAFRFCKGARNYLGGVFHGIGAFVAAYNSFYCLQNIKAIQIMEFMPFKNSCAYLMGALAAVLVAAGTHGKSR